MFSHRPQFRSFPLSSEDIRQVNETKIALDKQYSENQRQIQQYMNKPSLSNFELSFLKRLRERTRIIQQKMKENQQILRLQAIMQQQMKYKKAEGVQSRRELAQQYKTVINQKKNKQEKQKHNERQLEKALQYRNQQIQQELQKQKRIKQQQRKSEFIASLKMMQMVKQQIKKQQDRNKRHSQQSNRDMIRNDEEFQKHYNQYKETLLESGSSSPPKNTVYQNGISNYRLDQNTMQYHINNMDRFKPNHKYKVQLDETLKQQMQYKQFKKQRQKEQNMHEKHMTDLFIQKNSHIDRIQKELKKQIQKQYQQDLNRQLKEKQYIANRQKFGSKRSSRQQSNKATTQGKFSNMAIIGTNSLY